MPNHITNRLTIIGTEEEVAQVRAEIKGEREDQLIDFNTFIPIQKELEGTVSPMRIISQEEYDALELKIITNDLTENERNGGISRGLTKALSSEYIKKFGTDNWYDWQTRNWGTKWNAYEQVEHDANELEFDTAWSTPLQAMVHLSKKYPLLTFQVRYADEDFGYNVGEYTLINGNIEAQNIPDGGTQEALELAMEIKGDEEYYLTEYLCENVSDEDFSEYEKTLCRIAHNKSAELQEEYPVIVLNYLRELALADEEFERVVEIDELLAKANNTKDDEDYQSGLLYGVDNNQ